VIRVVGGEYGVEMELVDPTNAPPEDAARWVSFGTQKPGSVLTLFGRKIRLRTPASDLLASALIDVEGVMVG
jgi:hypothetical protein